MVWLPVKKNSNHFEARKMYIDTDRKHDSLATVGYLYGVFTRKLK